MGKSKSPSRSKKATGARTKSRGKRPPLAGESLADRKKRARRIITVLKKLYPEADTALKHADPLELLIATILSAQSTDETVNKVTPVLFAKYPTARELAAANAGELEKIVHPTGFFRQKTRSIINACEAIVEQFGGEVPQTLAELTQLQGVARKTANVVLGTCFGKNEGVVVDTHVGRLAHRLGLTFSSKNDKDAVKIERDLMQVIPQKEWTYAGHALIWHGRRVCPARKPRCVECALNKLCPAGFSFEPDVEDKPPEKRPPPRRS